VLEACTINCRKPLKTITNMNQQFIDLVTRMTEEYEPCNHLPAGAPPTEEVIREAIARIQAGTCPDYIGMGNPDADILLVGREKALDPGSPTDRPIILHELLLNHPHWYDIVVNHPNVGSHDPVMLGRPHPFTGFSPYNPLLFTDTWNIIARKGAHTYRRMWLAVNCGTGVDQVAGFNQMNNQQRQAWSWGLFDKVFITELSMQVARSSSNVRFKLKEWLQGPRYHFMSGMAAPFFQRFKTVVIYAGVKNRRYVGAPGSAERLALVRLFNPTLTHAHMHPLANGAVQGYANGFGARVLITPSLFMHVGIQSALTIQRLICPGIAPL
jgi:hypothetical protein